MVAYGGFIEFEHYGGREYHPTALALNSGRAALEHLLQALFIKKIYLPLWLCDSVYQPCRKHNVAIETYSVGYDFLPDPLTVPDTLEEGAYFYLVNYYGQVTPQIIRNFKQRYQRVIVDNAQAFFDKPVDDVPTLYTCRKFFGVADGAYVYGPDGDEVYPVATSHQHMGFLLGRFEEGPEEFYQDYVVNDQRFDNEPVAKMSRLTHNLLRIVDYDRIARIREENFAVVDAMLGERNRLPVAATKGPYMYPFYADNAGEIRKKLQRQRIYIPTLWPETLSRVSSTTDCDLADRILPLPIDQRYDHDDMTHIVDSVCSLL